MSTPIVTISEDASIEEAARIMSRKRIKKLPVVSGDKLVGIITSMDLVRAEPKLTALIESILKAS